MSCSGLHCGGCAGGAAVPPVALGVLYGFVWSPSTSSRSPSYRARAAPWPSPPWSPS